MTWFSGMVCMNDGCRNMAQYTGGRCGIHDMLSGRPGALASLAYPIKRMVIHAKTTEEKGAPMSNVREIGRRHPMQSVEMAEDGVVRFRPNVLVRYMLDSGTIDMNHLAALPNIPQEDREQFAQLIGYSVGGFGSLSYVSDQAYEAAAELSEAVLDGQGDAKGDESPKAELKPEFQLRTCANCNRRARYAFPEEQACGFCGTKGYLFPSDRRPMMVCDSCGRHYPPGTEACDFDASCGGTLTPMTPAEQKAWLGLREDGDRVRSLKGLFAHHKIDHNQRADIEDLREEGGRLAAIIDIACPRSADRSAAIRLLQDAVSTAIRSIALKGKGYRDYERKEE